MDRYAREDDALFEALKRRKRKRRRRIIRTTVFIILLLALGTIIGVRFLRRQVKESVAGNPIEVSVAEVTVGNISTQVSGSGTLFNVDEESITLPAGVTVDEVLVSANDSFKAGQILARVNSVSILNAMDTLQNKMAEIDNSIYSASGDTLDNTIASGVEGRVKIIFAQVGDDVVKCMAENGALAVLSLDGSMVVSIPAPYLAVGTEVRVQRENGEELVGTVESNINGIASILVSDNGPVVNEIVSVITDDGMIGNGTLSIHSALRISGTGGTIASSYITEDQRVYAGSSLFGLADLTYYARYQTLLSERAEMEETFLDLMELYQTGGVSAPYDGSVSTVDYDESSVTEENETAMFTISPDKSMQVTIDVDESNILSLEVGQTALVTISSIGDDVFPGRVTEINKTANSSSGVTLYSAIITMDKTPEMLQGMSAKAVVRIQGVDNALLIPIDALHQTSSTSYVYSGYDEESQTFTDLVQVTVGITNNSFAEIKSGLKEGDLVYYIEIQNNSGFPAGFGQGMPNARGNASGFGNNMPGGNNNFRQGSGNNNYGNNSNNAGNRPSGGANPPNSSWRG